jgi:uncharacterized RDD family membrane protein YckC
MLRRAVSVLSWTVVLVLGAFGFVFSFANYPLFGIGVLLVVLFLAGYSERTRRAQQHARHAARMRERNQPPPP